MCVPSAKRRTADSNIHLLTLEQIIRRYGYSAANTKLLPGLRYFCPVTPQVKICSLTLSLPRPQVLRLPVAGQEDQFLGRSVPPLPVQTSAPVP